MKANEKNIAKARELKELWEGNEETMGEMAAYEISCEMLGIDSDDGWDLLALLAETP